ncbi:MAG: thioredoxin [Lachnospiraceae bacterium]|nr:thioredoxin [Lachnospiraceae bacterium]MDE6626641.1 thioredoxin [Lachnospiraceae bacterium]
MAVINVTADNFEEEVLKSDKTVLVDFWAEWCVPCKRLSPVVDKLAEEHSEVKVAKVNIDEQAALAMDYKVMSIPTLVVFKNGEIVNQTVGLQSKEEIESMLG